MTREQIEKTYDAVLYGMTALRNNEMLWNWAMNILATKPASALATLAIDDDIEAEFVREYTQICDDISKKTGKPMEVRDRPILRALLAMLIEQFMAQLPGLIDKLFPPSQQTG